MEWSKKKKRRNEKEKKIKKGWVENPKGRLIQKKKGWVENLEEQLNQSKNLDELKTWKGGLVRERMINLRWVEIRSGASEKNDWGWKVEIGVWKEEVEK